MTARWYEKPFVVLDTETTGVDVERDRIVTCTVGWVGGREVELNSWLVDPGIEISAGATRIHGVTTEQARAEGQHPGEVLPLVAAVLAAAWAEGEPVAAFNACYDISLLDRELRRHGLPTLDVSYVVDPMVISRWADPELKGAGHHRWGAAFIGCPPDLGCAAMDAYEADLDWADSEPVAWLKTTPLYRALVDGLPPEGVA